MEGPVAKPQFCNRPLDYHADALVHRMCKSVRIFFLWERTIQREGK